MGRGSFDNSILPGIFDKEVCSDSGMLRTFAFITLKLHEVETSGLCFLVSIGTVS